MFFDKIRFKVFDPFIFDININKTYIIIRFQEHMRKFLSFQATKCDLYQKGEESCQTANGNEPHPM